MFTNPFLPATTSAAAPADQIPTPRPADWHASGDDAFFRLTAHLFPPSFMAGAGVLLASYDESGLD